MKLTKWHLSIMTNDCHSFAFLESRSTNNILNVYVEIYRITWTLLQGSTYIIPLHLKSLGHIYPLFYFQFGCCGVDPVTSDHNDFRDIPSKWWNNWFRGSDVIPKSCCKGVSFYSYLFVYNTDCTVNLDPKHYQTEVSKGRSVLNDLKPEISIGLNVPSHPNKTWLSWAVRMQLFLVWSVFLQEF